MDGSFGTGERWWQSEGNLGWGRGEGVGGVGRDFDEWGRW